MDIGLASSSGSTLKANMSAWWDLDETSGTRIDAHGNNNLSDNNGVTTTAGITRSNTLMTVTGTMSASLLPSWAPVQPLFCSLIWVPTALVSG